MYYYIYQSPVGKLLLVSDGNALIGLYPQGDPSYRQDVPLSDPQVFTAVLTWLDSYFRGEMMTTLPEISLSGTPFQMRVWKILLTIPYGKTLTYGQIAKQISVGCGIPRMSPQAVGNAVGANPISIIVPCHRVLGTGGKLTGYAAGLECKRKLLDIEQISYI